MSDTEMFILLLILFATVGVFGSIFGYQVDGEIVRGGISNFFDFIVNLSAFNIDNMPWILSLVFDCIWAGFAWLGYRAIRGISS